MLLFKKEREAYNSLSKEQQHEVKKIIKVIFLILIILTIAVVFGS